MYYTMAEKIRIALHRRNMTLADLAKALDTSRQNVSNKLSRDNFTEKELLEIASALNCTYKATFIMNDTGDEI